MKKETRFTEEDLQAVYSALVSMNQELVGMRKKVDRICGQAPAPALDGIVYIIDQEKGKTRAARQS